MADKKDDKKQDDKKRDDEVKATDGADVTDKSETSKDESADKGKTDKSADKTEEIKSDSKDESANKVKDFGTSARSGSRSWKEEHDSRRAARSSRRGLSTPVWIALTVVVLLVGIGCGIGCAYFLRQGSAGIVLGDSVAGKTSLTEADLDKPMGSYNYAGSSYSITAREVIESSSSLDAAKKDDQTYKVPSADSVISVARNQIFSKICDAKNITVSDEEVSEFAQKMVGTSDFSTIASKYGIGEDSIKTQVTAAARLSKLRSETVKAKLPVQPTAPTAPSDGNNNAENGDYATYIIGLAGDEWDSSTGSWKSSDSAYATALADYKITNESASYAAAQAAYYVATQQYQAEANAYSSEWNGYLNEELCKANLTLSTLVS
ncbi:MAG: hypothetical protein ACFNLW_11325 [Olsenella sp.]